MIINNGLYSYDGKFSQLQIYLVHRGRMSSAPIAYGSRVDFDETEQTLYDESKNIWETAKTEIKNDALAAFGGYLVVGGLWRFADVSRRDAQFAGFASVGDTVEKSTYTEPTFNSRFNQYRLLKGDVNGFVSIGDYVAVSESWGRSDAETVIRDKLSEYQTARENVGDQILCGLFTRTGRFATQRLYRLFGAYAQVQDIDAITRLENGDAA